VRGSFAEKRLGQLACKQTLADPLRADEEIGMRQPAALDHPAETHKELFVSVYTLPGHANSFV
jgi:hypothetical protein